jgi:hypothetical protein
MTGVTLIVLAATHLEDADLRMKAMREHRRLDSRTPDYRRANLQLSAATDSQDLVEHDLLPDFGSNLLHLDFFADSNLVLFATGSNDRVHLLPRV